MELAALTVALDARRAREEVKALTGDLDNAATKADALASRGQKSLDAFAASARNAKTAFSEIKNEVAGWEQSTARLMIAQGNLVGSINFLKTSLVGLSGQINQVVSSYNQLGRIQLPRVPNAPLNPGGGSGTNVNWSGLTSSLLGYVAAYISLRSAISATEELLHTQILFENFDLSLKAITGSANAAKGEFQFLREESNRLGLNLKSVIPEFLKIEAAFSQSGFTLRQSEQIFTDVSIATRALGLSTAVTNRVLYDMQEMASLGTVQMRQMRQVIMQLPGGLEVAARAAGVTTEQFHALMHDGLIPAKEFLPLFSAELAKTFGSSAQEAMHSTESELNRLSNAWTLLKKAVSENINFKAALTGIAGALDDTALRLEGHNLGNRASDAVPNNSRNVGGDYRSNLTSLLKQRFPYSEIPTVDSRFNLESEYVRLAHGESAARDNWMRNNPVQGPPLPEGFGGGAGDDATQKQAQAFQKLTELRDKYTEVGLEGLDKELASIKRNYDTEIKLLTEAYKASGKLILPGGSLDMSGTQADFDKNGNPFAMAAAVRDRAVQNAVNNASMKEETSQAQELTKQYREFQKITAEIESQSQPDRRLSELASENQKYKERYSQLIAIDEEMTVSQEIFDKLNESHALEIALINERYTKTFVGEGTLSELLFKRIDLEKQLLAINESDPEGAQRAQKIQQQITAINKNTANALATGDRSPAESFTYGWNQAMVKFGTTSQQIASDAEKLAGSMSDGITNALYDMSRGTKTAAQAFSEMALSVTADIEKMILKTLVLKAIQGISGVFGGASNAGGGTSDVVGGVVSDHAGGIVGFSTAFRSLSSEVFAGARRYHTGGVVGDEVPIVARKGEGVFTPEQMAQLGKTNAKGVQVHIINAVDPRMVLEVIAANPAAILNVINKEKSTVKRIVSA